VQRAPTSRSPRISLALNAGYDPGDP